MTGHASLDTECPDDRVVRPGSDVMQIKGSIQENNREREWDLFQRDI